MSDMVRRAENFHRGQPLLRALVSLGAAAIAPPLGAASAALDPVLGAVLARIRENRLNILLEAMAEGRAYLTPELVQSEPFLQRFLLTLEAVLQTQEAEKIRLFAQLLLAPVRGDPGTDLSDNFDQFHSILRDLTPREVQLLRVIDAIETTHAQEPADRRDSSGPNYETTIAHELKILPEAVWPTIARLARTGLCRPPMYGALTDETGPVYLLTPLYPRFAEWLELSKASISARR